MTNNQKKKTSRKSKSEPLIPQPDSWEWEYKDDTKVLHFYENDVKVLSIPITENTAPNLEILAAEIYSASTIASTSEAIEELDNYILSENNMADAWSYRMPSDTNLPNHLLLLKNNEVMGILPINITVGQKLLLKLNHFKPVYYGTKETLSWFKKHKIITGLLIAFLGYGVILMLLDFIKLFIPES